MIVPLKKILEQSNYYIKVTFVTSKQEVHLFCSWTQEFKTFRIIDYGFTAKTQYIIDTLVRQFCKYHQYPYEFIISYKDDDETKIINYAIILPENEQEKIENLNFLYYNLIQEGLTPSLIDLAKENNLMIEFNEIISIYLGIKIA